jgi:hypothetical protein
MSDNGDDPFADVAPEHFDAPMHVSELLETGEPPEQMLEALVAERDAYLDGLRAVLVSHHRDFLTIGAHLRRASTLVQELKEAALKTKSTLGVLSTWTLASDAAAGSNRAAADATIFTLGRNAWASSGAEAREGVAGALAAGSSVVTFSTALLHAARSGATRGASAGTSAAAAALGAVTAGERVLEAVQARVAQRAAAHLPGLALAELEAAANGAQELFPFQSALCVLRERVIDRLVAEALTLHPLALSALEPRWRALAMLGRQPAASQLLCRSHSAWIRDLREASAASRMSDRALCVRACNVAAAVMRHCAARHREVSPACGHLLLRWIQEQVHELAVVELGAHFRRVRSHIVSASTSGSSAAGDASAAQADAPARLDATCGAVHLIAECAAYLQPLALEGAGPCPTIFAVKCLPPLMSVLGDEVGNKCRDFLFAPPKSADIEADLAATVKAMSIRRDESATSGYGIVAAAMCRSGVPRESPVRCLPLHLPKVRQHIGLHDFVLGPFAAALLAAGVCPDAPQPLPEAEEAAAALLLLPTSPALRQFLDVAIGVLRMPLDAASLVQREFAHCTAVALQSHVPGAAAPVGAESVASAAPASSAGASRFGAARTFGSRAARGPSPGLPGPAAAVVSPIAASMAAGGVPAAADGPADVAHAVLSALTVCGSRHLGAVADAALVFSCRRMLLSTAVFVVETHDAARKIFSAILEGVIVQSAQDQAAQGNGNDLSYGLPVAVPPVPDLMVSTAFDPTLFVSATDICALVQAAAAPGVNRLAIGALPVFYSAVGSGCGGGDLGGGSSSHALVPPQLQRNVREASRLQDAVVRLSTFLVARRSPLTTPPVRPKAADCHVDGGGPLPCAPGLQQPQARVVHLLLSAFADAATAGPLSPPPPPKRADDNGPTSPMRGAGAAPSISLAALLAAPAPHRVTDVGNSFMEHRMPVLLGLKVAQIVAHAASNTGPVGAAVVGFALLRWLLSSAVDVDMNAAGAVRRLLKAEEEEEQVCRDAAATANGDATADVTEANRTDAAVTLCKPAYLRRLFVSPSGTADGAGPGTASSDTAANTPQAVLGASDRGLASHSSVVYGMCHPTTWLQMAALGPSPHLGRIKTDEAAARCAAFCVGAVWEVLQPCVPAAAACIGGAAVYGAMRPAVAAAERFLREAVVTPTTLDAAAASVFAKAGPEWDYMGIEAAPGSAAAVPRLADAKSTVITAIAALLGDR